MIIPRPRFDRLRWRQFFWANCGCCDAPQECTFSDDFSSEQEGYTIVDMTNGVGWELKIDATGGTYTITMGGQTTAPINHNSHAGPFGADTIRAILEALSNVESGDVFVTKTTLADGYAYRISWSTSIPRADALGMTIDDSSLTGGTGITAYNSEPNFTWGGSLTLRSVADGGVLGDDAVITRTITRPALNGLEISVAATVSWVRLPEPDDDTIVTSTVGVTIGNAFNFAARARPPFNTPSGYVRNPANANGTSTGSGGTTFAPASIEGGRMKMIIRDVSGGAGTYDVEYLVDGTQIRLEEDVALTLPDPLVIGLIATDGGVWDDLCIETNA